MCEDASKSHRKYGLLFNSHSQGVKHLRSAYSLLIMYIFYEFLKYTTYVRTVYKQEYKIIYI